MYSYFGFDIVFIATVIDEFVSFCSSLLGMCSVCACVYVCVSVCIDVYETTVKSVGMAMIFLIALLVLIWSHRYFSLLYCCNCINSLNVTKRN